MTREDVFDSKNLIAGEVVRKGIQITKNVGTLGITSACYAVYNAETGAVVTSPTSAGYDNDSGTVWGNITAGTTAGQYYIDFTFVDSQYTKKARLHYEVK